ncbi:hypothetical protein GIB67_005135 [Kingdonia uniflora]|uniref:APO domain-containing protein n=1 Tax=Kingdonia uniflora TaxID=39325 RepID=A0A7J7LAB4_9MAGN|nr:hypothetical protein GIB67_005135 [Kingdonia uniflora]
MRQFEDLTKDPFFDNVDVEEDYHSNHTSQDSDDVPTMDHIEDHKSFADNRDFVMASSNLYKKKDHEDEEPFLPPQAPESMLTIGIEWPNIYECRSFMRNFAITQRFTFREKKNESKRIRYVCKERPSCLWWVFITRLNDGHTMTLKNGHFIHEYSGKNGTLNINANVIWVAKEIENLIRDASTTKPMQISDIVYRRFGVRVSYYTVWNARNMVMEKIVGSYDKGYALCLELCVEIQKSNPGSIATCSREDGNLKFTDMCINFKAALDGFTKGCRPILGLDGCFLKGKYCSHYHKVAAYVATYNQAVNPIADSSEWGEPTREIRPPPLLRPAGRPRTLKRREADEVNGVVRQPRRCIFFGLCAVLMALRKKIWHHLWKDSNGYFTQSRYYSSKVDWNKLRPMILKRIQNRSKIYPLKSMIPVAYDVLEARALLFDGVSTLLKVIPVKACKQCPEVYIGENGHMIKTCRGYKHGAKNLVHNWAAGSLSDILVPVEAFHLRNMFQDVIEHYQRFDYDRIPAVLELCYQAGAEIDNEYLHFNNSSGVACESLSPDELKSVANRTMRAYERLRSGLQKLLLVYPTKVCQYCSEVHIGPSGHKARLCGVFKHESRRGGHFWKKAEVDNLVPPKVVWRRRSQDPQVLFDKGRYYYGHAPAIVELCLQGGAVVPAKYFCMMKLHGFPPPPLEGVELTK